MFARLMVFGLFAAFAAPTALADELRGCRSSSARAQAMLSPELTSKTDVLAERIRRTADALALGAHVATQTTFFTCTKTGRLIEIVKRPTQPKRRRFELRVGMGLFAYDAGVIEWAAVRALCAIRLGVVPNYLYPYVHPEIDTELRLARCVAHVLHDTAYAAVLANTPEIFETGVTDMRTRGTLALQFVRSVKRLRPDPFDAADLPP